MNDEVAKGKNHGFVGKHYDTLADTEEEEKRGGF
jgi:hypothetical protein